MKTRQILTSIPTMIIVTLILLISIAISTPINQLPIDQTSYKVGDIWHLGTLNFTIDFLHIHNISFTDGQIKFTIEDIPKNVSMIEIPAEITCNLRFTASFSIPVYIKWRLYGSAGEGGGSVLILPNGKKIQSSKSIIMIYFPEDENQYITTLDGYLLINLHYIHIPINQPSYVVTLIRK